MKHAILITAYKDFKELKRLVDQFDENFNIYIHIDKKSIVEQRDFDMLKETTNVAFVSQEYTVNWGGVNHLKSYLLLSEEALKKAENQYFHLITGEDFPIKNNSSFKSLFKEEIKSKIYMDCVKMPREDWSNGGMDRLEHYNFYDVLNAKSKFGRIFIYGLYRLQLLFNFKRKITFQEKLYGGSTYWTIPRNALEYVIDFTQEKPEFLNRFKHTFCAEEIYFQTIIMNSKYAQNVVDEDLRFIDWGRVGEVRPAYLDENDFDTIVASNKLFARKIKSNILKDMLTEHNK